MANTASKRRTTPERTLFDFAQRLDRLRESRCAAHFQFSLLQPKNRREHHIRVAVTTIKAACKQFDGQLHVLNNGDAMAVFVAMPRDRLDKLAQKIRYMFEDDASSRRALDDPEGLCNIYDLERAYPTFLVRCENLFEAAQRQREADARGVADEASITPAKTLTPKVLDALECALNRTDLINVLRRQEICRIKGDGPPQPVYRELYLSIDAVQETFLPDYDLRRDRWLFRHLVETLDHRLLSVVAHHDDSTIQARYSMNMSVQTVLSKDFQDFDSTLRANARGAVLVEMQFVDIMSDLRCYQYARDFLEERQYRMCVDGVAPLALTFLERGRLGLDFAKVSWSDDVIGRLDADEREQLAKDVKRNGEGRIILTRCESDRAIELGRAMGVDLFQGRRIDILAAHAKGARHHANTLQRADAERVHA